MKNTAEYLDALRAHYGVKSDYALSPLIGVLPQHLTKYRNKKSTFGEEFSLKIADILDIDPAQIFLDMHYQREKNEAAKQVWKRIYNSMTAVTAALAIAVMLPFISLPENGLINAGSFDNNDYYAYQNILNAHLCECAEFASV